VEVLILTPVTGFRPINIAVTDIVEQTTCLSFLKAFEKEREYPVACPKCNDHTDNTEQVISYQKSPY